MAERYAQAGATLSQVPQGKANCRRQNTFKATAPRLQHRPKSHRWSDASRRCRYWAERASYSKNIVGHAKGAEKPVTPRGSSAYATHAPDKEIVKLKVVTLTVGTQTLISTTDAGALQQWCVVQSSHQLELQTLQRKIGRILQDVASGHSTTRGSAAPPLPHQSDSSGYERRQSKLQPRGSGTCPADRRDPRVPYFVSHAAKYRPDTGHESPLAFSAPGTRLTSSRNREESNTAQKRQRSARRPRCRHKPRRSNEQPAGKRVMRKSAYSDTSESSNDSVFRRKTTRHQRESRHHTWTRSQNTNKFSHVILQTIAAIEPKGPAIPNAECRIRSW